MTAPPARSCWTCAYQQLGGDPFLGYCRWFEQRGEPKKLIPPHVVDVGCRRWEPKVSKEA